MPYSRRKLSLSKRAKSKSKDESYTSDDLPVFRRKRTLAYNRLAKAFEIGHLAIQDHSHTDLFLSYHQELKKISTAFEDAHLMILHLTEEDSTEDDLIRTRFDDMYFEIIRIFRLLTKSDLNLNTTSSHSTSTQLKLPKITLPSFSGNIKEWPEFISTYNALIHDAHFSHAEKFQYLISILKGDALALIRTFPTTGDFYIDAYQALLTRYENKRDLAFTCWRDILNIQFKLNNAHDFRTSLDAFEENLTILKRLKLPVDQWDFILSYHILSKLDTKLRREFEEKHTEIELPSYNDIKSFLHAKCEAFMRDTHFSELIQSGHQNRDSLVRNVSHFNVNKSKLTHTLVASQDNDHEVSKPGTRSVWKCSFCSDEHSISTCKQFLEKNVDERMAIANDKRWCFNCLKSSHQIKDCKSLFTCQKCKHRHHTLLHKDRASSEQANVVALVTQQPYSKSEPIVLLSTAIVDVLDASGSYHSLRALFDTGSQNNFITEHAARRLKLKPYPTSRSISGLGDLETSVAHMVCCDVGHHHTSLFSLEMFVIPKICGDQPIAKLNTDGWSRIATLPLADPGFDVPGPIEILLGADVFADSLLNGRIKGTGSQPHAFNSVFGWLLFGKATISKNLSLLGVNVTDHNDLLTSVVQKFWEIDDVPQSSKRTPEEQLCEKKYSIDQYREQSGRYGVRLPFKEEAEPSFQGSRDIALQRLRAIERRLSRDNDLRTRYVAFMFDYLQTGHMSLVPTHRLGMGKYYIPHHCILRPESTTTKLRIVFDASAKDFNNKSLNESLLIGPKLQNDIVTILLHFREHKIVFMADVRQMYRQILVHSEHRDYQRILWRFHPDAPIQEYVLNTVTFGTSVAPFLACRTIQQLAHDEGDKYPVAKHILLEDIYVDDVVSGCSSLSEASEAKAQVIELFKQGHFELHKWASNVPELLTGIPLENRLSEEVSFSDTQSLTLKVLGLKWETSSDSFIFDVQPVDQKCTKRVILSELARIFDPLGFLTPLTIQAKVLIQKLWIIGISWDEIPPSDIIKQWSQYLNQLHKITLIKIPRCITMDSAVSYEIHGFCDSSELAYGAVIYIRVTDEQGSVKVFLYCAKARVAPIKRISLPRLELCAAVLLANLIKTMKNTFRISLKSMYLWSDSTVVLSWLKSHSSRWVTFVANRVAHIQDTVPSNCWRYVPTKDNPADVCSRGQFPDALVHNSLWWAGPTWLYRSPDSWPINIVEPCRENEVHAEQRSVNVLLSNETAVEASVIDVLFEKFSSLDKIIHVIAYLCRFIHNSRNPNSRSDNPTLSSSERHKAFLIITKFYQGRYFHDDITRLQTGNALSKTLRKLNPFIDSDGILRVGGRISRSGLEYEHKHPALLPSKCMLTYRFIEQVHKKNCHPGINTTHYLIIQQFWIISARRVVRHILSKCVRCYKTRPQPLQPFMSDLPKYRVNQVKAFSVVGVDFGGPFRIKVGRHRGAKIDKAYLCLFVCLATKAVHLEVASSLSSDAFIAALRRFISRRGRCNVIHADCGTNFVGARNQLSSLMREAAHTERIDFKFNPPAAAHWGGVWEIQIKSAKSHLYRIIGEQVLTFEELTTLFSQIEAILNSRPLCPLSSDPNDLQVLTPGHFLTLEPLTTIPEEDFSEVNLRRLTRWQLLQAFHQHFWLRWKNEYLHSLTQRAKWTKISKPLPINSLVMIKDDNRIPLHWPIGRVVDLHPGPDGIVRLATLRIANNHLIKRPLVKLCPLPIDQ